MKILKIFGNLNYIVFNTNIMELIELLLLIIPIIGGWFNGKRVRKMGRMGQDRI